MKSDRRSSVALEASGISNSEMLATAPVDLGGDLSGGVEAIGPLSENEIGKVVVTMV